MNNTRLSKISSYSQNIDELVLKSSQKVKKSSNKTNRDLFPSTYLKLTLIFKKRVSGIQPSSVRILQIVIDFLRHLRKIRENK